MWTRALREERTRAIVNDLERVQEIISTNFLENRHDYDGNYVNAVKDFLTLEDAKAIVKKCSECQCCEDHKKNRPTSLIHREYSVNPHQERERECQCSCRHFSRWVCRAYGDSIDDRLP